MSLSLLDPWFIGWMFTDGISAAIHSRMPLPAIVYRCVGPATEHLSAKTFAWIISIRSESHCWCHVRRVLVHRIVGEQHQFRRLLRSLRSSIAHVYLRGSISSRCPCGDIHQCFRRSGHSLGVDHTGTSQNLVFAQMEKTRGIAACAFGTGHHCADGKR